MKKEKSENAAVRQYLEEYCSPLIQRDFAVLLDGPWGAGKTHFIKDFLKGHPNHLYVSLYGMSDVRQIDDEIFRQLHPVLASDGMRLFGRVAKGFLKGTLKIDLDGDGTADGNANVAIPDLNLKSHLSDPEGHLLVFDDLERCNLNVSEVLGYINVFVEHTGMKAIILGNEAEIGSLEGNETYHQIKEKLIGQTLRVNATVEEAYTEFLKGIDNQRVAAFLSEQRETAIAIHRNSQTNNLRLLKQSLWDYERLAACFQDSHWENAEAMSTILQKVLALSIEHRAGNLKDTSVIRSLVDGRMLRRMSKPKDAPKTVADEIEEKYLTIDFGDKILDTEILSDAVLHGHVEAETVRESLAQSPYFAELASIPLWQRAWDYFDLNDHQAAELAQEFRSAFESRQFEADGEVFHAFGIILRYSDIGLLSISREEALIQCKQYVDDLFAAGRIEFDPERQSHFDFQGAYAGHGFMEREKDDFVEAVAYYEKRYEQVAQSEYESRALDLIAKLESGSDEFLLDLAPNNVRVSRYSDRPILAAVDPEEFAKKIMGLKGKEQRLALNSLNERYRFISDETPLADELPWLSKVREALQGMVSASGPVTRERLGYLIKTYLDAVLSRWQDLQAKKDALTQSSTKDEDG